MSRESFIFLLGFCIFFTPFLGVPNEWKEWIFIGSGVLIMSIGYTLRRQAFLRSIESEGGERRSDAFVERTHGGETSQRSLESLE
jgi:hypothetical protein